LANLPRDPETIIDVQQSYATAVGHFSRKIGLPMVGLVALLFWRPIYCKEL
jgi:hypothetical protein